MSLVTVSELLLAAGLAATGVGVGVSGLADGRDPMSIPPVTGAAVEVNVSWGVGDGLGRGL